MKLLIGIPSETVLGERRLAVVPEAVKKYQALGVRVLMQSGAGIPTHYKDEAFTEVRIAAGGHQVCARADGVLCVQPRPTS